jgi:putative ABC transport system permease protein
VVAPLVGGIGIANTMVISVLERRTEIGVRRAPGAARRHVAA